MWELPDNFKVKNLKMLQQKNYEHTGNFLNRNSQWRNSLGKESEVGKKNQTEI